MLATDLIDRTGRGGGGRVASIRPRLGAAGKVGEFTCGVSFSTLASLAEGGKSLKGFAHLFHVPICATISAHRNRSEKYA